MLRNDSVAQFDTGFFRSLQRQVVAYYEGARVNFDPEIPVLRDGFPAFGASVLMKCRQLQFGQTISYAGLAAEAGRPAACRAVGGALARNPMPLIVACHRVLRADGGLGGFSAPGGTAVKREMLELERQGLSPGRVSNHT